LFKSKKKKTHEAIHFNLNIHKYPGNKHFKLVCFVSSFKIGKRKKNIQRTKASFIKN